VVLVVLVVLGCGGYRDFAQLELYERALVGGKSYPYMNHQLQRHAHG
jgi:hypothetical protein